MASITYRSPAAVWTRAQCLGDDLLIGADCVSVSVVDLSGAGSHSQPYVIGEVTTRNAPRVLAVPCGCRVRINGHESLLSLHLLADRDEIRLFGGSHRFYFLQREPVRVEPFVSTGNECFCPRCTAQVNEGTSVVICSGCGTVYHAPCWSYGEATCVVCQEPCQAPGEISDTASWSPSDL